MQILEMYSFMYNFSFLSTTAPQQKSGAETVITGQNVANRGIWNGRLQFYYEWRRKRIGCGNEHIVIETEKTAVRYERFYSSFFIGLFGAGTIPF